MNDAAAHFARLCEDLQYQANSGLDMVMEISVGGEVLREWDALDGHPWERFSRETEYRWGVKTKQRSHPNYVFMLGEEVWATRQFQKDAVALKSLLAQAGLHIEHIQSFGLVPEVVLGRAAGLFRRFLLSTTRRPEITNSCYYRLHSFLRYRVGDHCAANRTANSACGCSPK